MTQLPLFDISPSIVNISKVTHLSPFRYAGGKTWFIPTLRLWLAAQDKRPKHFIEPFAGGAIVGLTVAIDDLADHVTLVELDEQVAAVWQTIIEDGEADWLGQQICDFDLTIEHIHKLFNQPNQSIREQALQTIIKNRVNRGGILAKGAGMLKAGENGRGIASRWYPETLQRRIQAIAEYANKLSFIWGDGLQVIEQHLDDPNAVFFIDPPYTVSGKKPGARLYNYSDVNHHQLFELMSAVKGEFLMTYNDDEAVIALAKRYGFEHHPIAMKNTHHAKKQERIIGRDLSWLKR